MERIATRRFLLGDRTAHGLRGEENAGESSPYAVQVTRHRTTPGLLPNFGRPVWTARGVRVIRRKGLWNIQHTKDWPATDDYLELLTGPS